MSPQRRPKNFLLRAVSLGAGAAMLGTAACGGATEGSTPLGAGTVATDAGKHDDTGPSGTHVEEGGVGRPADDAGVLGLVVNPEAGVEDSGPLGLFADAGRPVGVTPADAGHAHDAGHPVGVTPADAGHPHGDAGHAHDGGHPIGVTPVDAGPVGLSPYDGGESIDGGEPVGVGVYDGGESTDAGVPVGVEPYDAGFVGDSVDAGGSFGIDPYDAGA